MLDQYERVIDYVRLSVTDRCNLRCHYCMPENGIDKQDHSKILRNEDYVLIVRALAALGIKKVRLTGGEPLIRKGLTNLIQDLRAIEGIEEVTLTTNGTLLHEQVQSLKEVGLDRINVSLDSLDKQMYSNITRGGDLTVVLKGIETARALGMFPIKINVVLIQGENANEIDQFLNALHPDFEIRFIELMPIGEAASWSREKFMNLNEVFNARTDMEPMTLRRHNGPCKYFKHLPTGRRVGVINTISEHFCDSCNRLRVTSDGMLKMCLHSPEEVNLRPFLQDFEALTQALASAILSKPKAHTLNEDFSKAIQRNMYTIGG